jgi:hypothetical protein
MKHDSPDFDSFLAAIEASSDEPVVEIELHGRRMIIERNPEPGVLARMRRGDDSDRSALTQYFDALDQRPSSYPAWLPFIAGHEVTVAVWGAPKMCVVSWPEVKNADDVIEPLIEFLRQEGWTGEEERTGRGDEPAEFLAFERDGHRCMVMAGGLGEEWLVTLTYDPQPSRQG